MNEVKDTSPTTDEQSSTFYETILNSDESDSRKISSLVDETCDEPVSNYQLLNELSVNDIETFVKKQSICLIGKRIKNL